MPLSPRDRIADEARRPAIVALWRALQPLRTVLTYMNSGAHPDDEHSSLLAALTFRDGIATAIACANRGEGGQNDIGTEAGLDLGTLRTAEMERAAEVLDCAVYWLSQSPDDPITDFGFSKSGAETLARWGRARTLARFVEILRAARPDMLCVTFLDVPGQHGHHRAMTELAHVAVDAAADPGFDAPGAPWQLAKLLLPAWSGAGGAYDDELPPPEATFTVPGGGVDPVTGWSFARIGQQSRWYHATQGMGAWVAPGAERDWPLHLVRSTVAGDGLTGGLPLRLADLGRDPALAEADAAIDAALAAFPDGAAVARAAARAHRALARASVAADHRHRTARKAAQLARVIRLAAGVEARARLSADWLLPGDVARLEVERRDGLAEAVEIAPILPAGWDHAAGEVRVGADAPPADPYPDRFDPLDPPAPALAVTVTLDGLRTETRVPWEATPVLLPARTATPVPGAVLLNLATPGREVSVQVTDIQPAGASPALDLPAGWAMAGDGGALRLSVLADVVPGLYTLPLTLDGAPAQRVRRIAHAHVPPRARAAPAVLRLRAVAVALPEARVGYVGSGNDRVAHWLRAMGLGVHELTDADLADAGALARFDTLVIGVFTLRFRPALAPRWAAITGWVRAGGTLVTLYHRPWDGWDPDTIPPLRLEIGQPSLRWRVTDEGAAVTHLAPDHPILTGPNPIGPDDWAGWHKERGLYFARAWDPAYVPLVEMADPDEAPHRGALLSAAVGQGRHSHCALILHHQMEHLVPGAFRLMANLCAPAR